MNPALAKQFHEVVGYGLDLKERVEQGARPPLDYELERLRSMLLGGSELKSDPEYVGDPGAGSDGGLRVTGRGADAKFFGARYALSCWLDEIFIADSPYSDQWNERALEFAIFRTRDRAEGFWDQSRLAERRPGTDALEVFYWCVMLGFRGQLRDQPEKLRDWTLAIRDRIRRTHRVELSLPADQGFDTFVPQLVGKNRFSNMVKVAAILALVAVPIIVVLVMRSMSAS
jgi:type VI secretion system protein ImpK